MNNGLQEFTTNFCKIFCTKIFFCKIFCRKY